MAKFEYDLNKNIELYLLKAESFKEDIAPNQRKYYLDVAEWMRQNHFTTAEEAVAAMRNTEYYEGGTIAQTADDIELRIKAMEKVGYADVADVHRMRREKFRERGKSYAFSQEWLDDYKTVGTECEKYARRKEIFGKIFSGYFQIAGSPQSDYRKEAAQDIALGLQELQSLGVSFDELAADRVYRELTMTTEKGMENFVDFVHDFIRSGSVYEDDISEIKAEQQELAAWARANKEQLIAAGSREKWSNACCIAVPSDDPGGYDFVAKKEVE